MDEQMELELAEALAGNDDLYNKIMDRNVTHAADVSRLNGEKESLEGALAAAKEREQKLLQQISNLLSRVPIGNAAPTEQSYDDKMKAILNQSWA